MNRRNQGFTVVEGGLLLVVLGGLVLVGWTVFHRAQNRVASTAAVISSIPSAPTVSSAADLDTAAKLLDQTNVDNSSDTAQLDKDLSSL